MKKKLLSILMIGTMLAVTVTGCGNKKQAETENETQTVTEESSESTEYAIVKDNIKVGQYKGISVNGYDTSVSESDIDSFIDYVLQYTAVSETPAETTSEDAETEAKTETEETKEEVVEETAGEEATAETTSTETLTHEQLTDELVVKISDGQYSNVADYRAYVKDVIKAQNESYYTDTIKNDLFETVLKSSVLGTYSEDDLARYVKYANEYYAEYAEYLGIDLNTFITENLELESEDKFNEFVQNEARDNLLREYVINAIAEAEGISITDTEINDEIKKYIDQGYFATEEEVLEYISKDEIGLNLKYYKILEIIYDNANVVPFTASDANAEAIEETLETETVEDASDENVEVVEEQAEEVTEEVTEDASTETSN